MIETVTLDGNRMRVGDNTFIFDSSDYGKYYGLVLSVYDRSIKDSIPFKSLLRRFETVKPHTIRFHHNVLSITYIRNGKVSKEFNYKARIERY